MSRENRVDQAFEGIKKLISRNITKEKIIEAIGDLNSGEFPLLFAKLEEFKETKRKKYYSDVDETVSHAQADAMFSPGGLSSHMGDWYDNEVRATHIQLRRDLSSIDSIIELLREVE